MDTSSEYIKMCDKAKEIQSPQPDNPQGEFVYCEGLAYQEMDDRPLTPYVWLPRQDQLQDMLGLNLRASWLALDSFIRWYIEDYMEECDFPKVWDTWGQLWLAFVMKEKYDKTWNGNDWINP